MTIKKGYVVASYSKEDHSLVDINYFARKNSAIGYSRIRNIVSQYDNVIREVDIHPPESLYGSIWGSRNCNYMITVIKSVQHDSFLNHVFFVLSESGFGHVKYGTLLKHYERINDN